MNLQVKIENVDRTNLIAWENFSIEDNINEQPNMCKFTVKVFESQSYKPEISDEVIVFDGAEKIFAGNIIRVMNSAETDIVYYDIEVKDYTSLLDRILINEHFQSKTVAEIITFINDNYLSDFGITENNVFCDIELDTIAFPNLPASNCFSMLADLVGYFWYIDYNKDIHFIAKNGEVAPYNITDDSDNYITDSLTIESDISQLRNAVKVEGGEITSDNPRTKQHTADGVEGSFATDYKFAEKPTVLLNSVAQTVGLDNIDQAVDFDCLWSYNQKYVKFSTVPTLNDNIEISAVYKIPILVQVENSASISEYGRFEFAKVDKTLLSTEEAKQYAESQLSAYAGTIREGGFLTYDSGLVSGQTININSVKRDISDSFVIQSVSLEMRTPTDGEWTAELATIKTLDLIGLLQQLLLRDKQNLDINEDVVIKKFYLDYQEVAVQEFISVKLKMEDHQDVEVDEDLQKDPFGANTPPDFVYAPYTPTSQTDPKREGVWGKSYWNN